MSWLSSFFDPPAQNINLPQMTTYAPTGMGGAEAGALGGINNLSNFNLVPQLLPQAQQFTNDLLFNPYAGGMQAGAGQAGQMGQSAATNAFNTGGGLQNLGWTLAGTAFDPQNALYDRTAQRLQDQTRAGQAARGIAMTPYGAGLEDQSMRDFNIDWQNNRLNRQVAGANAASGLISSGTNMQAGAPGQYFQASSLPFQTYRGIGQGRMGDLSNLAQFGQGGAAIPQQQIQNLQNYLGWGNQAMNMGNQAQRSAFDAALARDQQSFGQQQSIFGGLGNMFGGLWGTPMGGGGGGSGGAGTFGSSVLGGIGSLASLLPIFSDERVKDDIAPVGELFDGTPVYSYRYKGDATPRIGLIAQDVERRRPDAVVEIDGIKAVDYGRATEWSRGLAALSAWG